MQINKLTIIGTGLIGGSLALALKQQAACKLICGYDTDHDSLRQAQELGVIDEHSTDLAEAVQGAEVVVLAVPVIATVALLQKLAGLISAQTIVTDVASAKAAVVAAAREHLRQHLPNFVPAHPIAGREQGGVQAGSADLFADHALIITPLQETAATAKDRISAMWQQTGARVVELPVQQHDEILAATSHLPHVLAYALVDCLAAMQDQREIFAYSAGGLADFSRIASSSPQMWCDVCLANREPLLRVLAAFDEHLQELKQAINESDAERLLQVFSRAKQARDKHTS
ncbi:MAG: prephenate dehydrogenase [Gammaproteobacteria bacterium]